MMETGRWAEPISADGMLPESKAMMPIPWNTSMTLPGGFHAESRLQPPHFLIRLVGLVK